MLGHLLRGGSPTAFDRLLGLRFGAAAVRGLAAGHDGVMVSLNPPTVDYVPLAEATRRMKSVPLDCDSILTARELGINFGDRCRRSELPLRNLDGWLSVAARWRPAERSRRQLRRVCPRTARCGLVESTRC